MLNICKDIINFTLYTLSEKVKNTNLKLESVSIDIAFRIMKKLKKFSFSS